MIVDVVLDYLGDPYLYMLYIAVLMAFIWSWPRKEDQPNRTEIRQRLERLNKSRLL